MTDYLEDMQKRVVRFRFLCAAIEGEQRSEERKRFVDEELDLFTWFEAQPEVLREKFKPFLSITNGLPA
jgi:hypothetical protein